MRTRDLLQLAYRAFGDVMKGNTLLQKRMYFVSVILGKEAELGYYPHYFGPYSSDIADANSQLVSLGFVSEAPSDFGLVDRSGFEVIRHDYRLTEAGCHMAEKRKRLHPQEWQAMQQAAERIQAAGDLGYMELSIAAKAYYLLCQERGTARLSELRERAQTLGWSIGSTELDRAATFLERMDLVEREA